MFKRKYQRTENFQDKIARLYGTRDPQGISPEDLSKHKGLTRTCTLQVTDACNLACTYCYQINKHHHRMSFDIAKRYIDMILEDDKDKVIQVKHAFKEKNVALMKKRGINFVNYNFQVNLTPYNKVLSEVIINMDEFRKQYPSCTEQQFREVYLMAQAINSCKRDMKSSFKKRKNWALCVKVESGEKPFEFAELLDKLTTELRSEQMDNFITRVV